MVILKLIVGVLSLLGIFVSGAWGLSFSMDQEIQKDLTSRGGPFYLSWGTYRDF